MKRMIYPGQPISVSYENTVHESNSEIRSGTSVRVSQSLFGTSMRLILTALGSYGDVHPMVGLGAAMRRRGHQVFIIANPHFRSVIESAQLQLLPIGTQKEYDDLAHHQDLWHPYRGPKMILRMSMVNLLRRLYDLIKTHYVAGETVLGAHPLDIASRIFQEQVDASLIMSV